MQPWIITNKWLNGTIRPHVSSFTTVYKSSIVTFLTRWSTHPTINSQPREPHLQWLQELKRGWWRVQHVSCSKHIKMLHFNLTNGIRMHENGGLFLFFFRVWTQEAVSQPHGQTTNDRWDGSAGPCQLSGLLSGRPASLRMLAASVETCPLLSNISTHTNCPLDRSTQSE